MRRDSFISWLESQLTESAVAVRRWTVDPGLEDLEIMGPAGQPLRLRVVRTPPTGGERASDAEPVIRPAGTVIERR